MVLGRRQHRLRAVFISLSTGFATASTYTEYAKVYADWNQNGVFTNAGERRWPRQRRHVHGLLHGAGPAKSGSTRLRVMLSNNTATTSCGSHGETEDYTLAVTDGTTRTDGNYLLTIKAGSGTTHQRFVKE